MSSASDLLSQNEGRRKATLDVEGAVMAGTARVVAYFTVNRSRYM